MLTIAPVWPPSSHFGHGHGHGHVYGGGALDFRDTPYRTYFTSRRGLEVMGPAWSYLDRSPGGIRAARMPRAAQWGHAGVGGWRAGTSPR